jgi:hypothetical protein
MAIDRAPRRIIQLEKMDDSKITKLSEPPDTKSLSDDEKAANWHMSIDYKDESATGDNATDYGTLRIPFSSIAMRDANGKIPSIMLPSYVDDMMFGELTKPSGRVQFVEHVNGTSETRTYVSPPSARTGHPEYLEPPQNIVFVDTTTNIQYRFIKVNETDSANNYGFAEVPGSRALSAGYGIELSDGNNNSTKISARKADFVASTASSSSVVVTSTAAGIPIGTTESTTLTVVSSSNRLSKITGLRPSARYSMNMQIECTPDALSSNIIDVSATCGYGSSSVVMKRQMDMSGPYTTSATSPNTPSITRLDYALEFKNADNNTELTVKISAEEAITVKTTRFTIFELL